MASQFDNQRVCFRCPACEAELVKTMSELKINPKPRCPECGSLTCIEHLGIRFRGSAATDRSMAPEVNWSAIRNRSLPGSN